MAAQIAPIKSALIKIALITGASRGLGFAFAKALARTHHIVAMARTTARLTELDDHIRAGGGSATLVAADITDTQALARMCRSIHERWGRVDLWVHTAIHAAPLGPAGYMEPKDWQRSVATNIAATGYLISFMMPLLGRTGHAIFLEDARAGEKFFGIYGASKAAQIALARSWQAETCSTGPRVSILIPAAMATPLRACFFPGEDKSALASPETEAHRLLASL